MQVFVGGKGGPEIPVHALNTATLNISSVVPITTTPVVTAPTGDSTYFRKDAGNSPITGPTQINNTLGVSGAATFTGPVTAANINKVVYVDGVTNTTVQAAINALPVGGGTVSIPPGTYVGPTSIPNSNTELICQSWLGCTLTYTAAQILGPNGSALDNIKLDGLIFDFGGNNGGLTLENLRNSWIAIQVQNTGTAAGLTLLAPNNTINLNFMRNYLPWIKTANTGEGLVLNGNANIPACGGAQGNGGAVFDNTFGRVYITNASGTNALDFTSGTDSMQFDQVFVDLAAGNTTGSAANFNSRCTSQAGDVGLLYFSHITLEFTGVANTYTGNLITAGNSIVKFGQLTGSNVLAGHVLQADPNAFIMGMWDDASPFSLSVPYSASNRPIVQQTYVPATAGANNYAPVVQWSSQLWNGASSVGSSWQLAPSAQASGQPTFDSLVLLNVGSANTNGTAGVGFQIPNRLIIAGSTSGNTNLSSNATGGGFLDNGYFKATQVIADQGSVCTNGELALSAGWQSTGSATVTGVKGNGQTCEWTITTGTTTAANPTVTDTLTNTLPNATSVCEMIITGGNRTAAAGDSFDQTTLSATAPVFTFQGTPTAGGKTYQVVRRCGP
jgi:hypothetical protein